MTVLENPFVLARLALCDSSLSMYIVATTGDTRRCASGPVGTPATRAACEGRDAGASAPAGDTAGEDIFSFNTPLHLSMAVSRNSLPHDTLYTYI